jgi:hypothetical protein
MGFGDLSRSETVTQQLTVCAMRKSVLVTTEDWHFLAAENDLCKIALSGLAGNVARVETEPQQMSLNP